MTWRERRRRRRELLELVDGLCTRVVQLDLLEGAVAKRHPENPFIRWRAGVSSPA